MMKKLTFLCSLLLLLAKSGFTQQVVLNEIQSSNWGIVSSGGKLEDWIELKNLTGNAITMSKFYLSDDRRNLTKWQFPSSIVIQANGLLMVFASGKNRIISGKPHTNFSLSSYSSEIFLSDSNGQLIDMHEASGITSKTSWARVPDGGSSWCILSTPTPGGTNGNGSCITEYAPVPLVSVAPGIYNSRQYITVTCPDSGTFKYTIDGSSVGTTAKTIGPKNSGTVIQVDSSCVLKIKAYKTGKHPSREWVGTYLMKQPTITMPIISVSLNPDSFSYLYTANDHDNEKAGYVEYMDKNGKVLTRFGANFTIHGNASSSFNQKGLRIETRPWLDSSNVDYQFFDKKISKFRNFNLKNAGVDWMSRHVTDLATSLIARETHVDYADGKFVLGYMNGKYYGVFDLREKFDNDFVAENHDVDPDSIDMLSYSGTVNYGKDSAWNALSSMVSSLNLSVDSNFAKVAKYIDLDNWIDYFTTETYIANTDWPGNNIKWWRPQKKDGKWRYILWDTDFGWGMFWSGNTADHNSLPSALSGGLLISNLMDNIAFRKKFINRYADLINTTFRYENVAGAVNPYNVFKDLYTIMDKEMPRAFTKWSGSTQSSSYNDWKTAYTAMQTWAKDRPKYARKNMKDQYSNMISDTVSLTFQVSPTGAGTIKVNTIYPRIGTGWKGTYYKGVEVTVTAIPNPGYEFTAWNINNNDSNITTSKNFTAATNIIASFTQVDSIEQPHLAITEINYNSNNTLNAGNWIELKNYGQSTVDLTGWVLETKTIWKKYQFPDGFKINSGEYIVLCSDTTQFDAVHQGQYRRLLLPFGLSNKEEQLQLKDPFKVSHLNIVWNNNNPWPMTADGHGRTMELLYDSADASKPSSWFNGCIGGSPGTAFSPCNEPFRISEINYNSPPFANSGDWIEIYNYKSDTLKMGGWKINDKDFWNSWTFADSFKIAPGQRRVICGDSAAYNAVNKQTAAYYLPGFNLKNNEDVLEFYDTSDVIAFSIAYADSFPFPFKADGKGYTLDLKDSVLDMSSGNSWRSVCISGSPGTTSSNCEGGIIISEVNYKSGSFNDAGDWFEVHNTSPNSFNMGGWTMTDDTTNNIYTIANNVILPGYGYLVFVADTTKFKTMYPWVKNYIGNFGFSLGSKSDAVKIYNTNGTIVNAMKYTDDGPWPSNIGGSGFTIELKDSDAWLSDGNQWRKSGCWGGSPGGPNTNCNDSLWIVEINYNSDNRADADDWIELYNASSKSIDISNWLFLDANPKDTFILPANTILNANERLVLASNLSKLYAVHDTITNAIGDFKFGLGRTAEQLVLRDPSGRLRFGMEYNSDSLWSSLPDGQGFTLSLIKNKTDFINRLSWTTACPAGSPGKADGICKMSMAFTEVNYLSEISLNSSDWVELINTGKIPADLSYAKFRGNTTNDLFVLPKTKLIFPGERIVLARDTTFFNTINPNIYKVGSFKFDLNDDSSNIYLLDPYNNTIATAFYSSGAGWPQGANGNGKTLERVNISNNPQLPSSWFDGCFGGSPSTQYSTCIYNPVVSEINYNPASFFNTGYWLELWNRSTTDSLDISDYAIRNAGYSNSFSIPKNTILAPNEHIVITADSTRFKQYFPNARMIGNFSFLMGNTQNIRIYDKQGRIKFFTSYSNANGWPQKANGLGFTLELDPNAPNYTSAATWFDGCFSGSPGEGYTPCNSLVKVSEINYQSNSYINSGDWIELYNTGKGHVNLQGWKIYNTDSTQFTSINQAITLRPQSYAVICNDSSKFDNINKNVIRLAGLFSLPDSSGTIKLYDADNTPMTSANYSNALGWPEGTNGNGHTAERSSLNADPALPSSWFTGCLGGSPGYAYQPCVEPIIISEVNYASHPKADAGDWLELYNTSSTNVDLSSWRLISDDKTRSHFVKNGVTLKPGERYILYSSPTQYKDIYGMLPNMGEQILFSLNAKDGFSLINNKSKLVHNNGWDSISTWPDANGSVYTLEHIDTAQGFYHPNNWTIGCPAGSPETGIIDCQGVLSVSEVNASSDGWYQTGDWIELANLHGVPFSPINYTVSSFKTPNKTYQVQSNVLLYRGDRIVVVQDSLRYLLTTGSTSFESTLPFMIDNNLDSLYISNRSGKMVYSGGFDATLSNMKDGYSTGRTLEVDENQSAQLASSWYAGCIGGTPGTAHIPCTYEVTINELSLIPASTVAAGTWIELHNKTNSPIDYQGYKIRTTSGEYIINQPLIISGQGYGIIAENKANFTSAWPTVSPVIGDNISLPGLKGRIALFDANSNVKFYVDYDSASPWPLYTTMPGRTLEMIDTATNPWDAASWIAGCYAGTPGRAFSTPCEYYGLGIQPMNHKDANYIYPNPNNGIYTLQLSKASQHAQISFINHLGQTVKTFHNQGNHRITINETSLAAGIYMIQIDNGQEVYYLKWIKE